MVAKFNPQTWISMRTKEPEFLAFMGASTPDEALAMTMALCSNPKEGGGPDTISAEAVDKLKVKYLADQRSKMGLPNGAGVF